MLRLENPRVGSIIGGPGVVFPLDVPDDGWYIKHKYDGLDELYFEIPRKAEYASEIGTEAIIDTEQNIFVIKNVDARGNIMAVDAQINIDAWKAPFWHSYRETAITIEEALTAIKPTGWTVSMIGTYTNRKTIDNGSGEPLQDVTALDIVGRICTIWGCVANYDTHNKVIKIIDPENAGDSGVILSQKTNLKSPPDFVDNSADYVTRLYPYGAKDETTGLNLTIESVNSGIPYVENGEYGVDKVVSMGWTDERFTDASSLKAAAIAKLAELAGPVWSFTYSLSEVDTAINMYQTVTIMESRAKEQVVEYVEYPYCHNLDYITLSALAPSISYDVYINEKQTSQAIEAIEDRITEIESNPPWIATDTDVGAVSIGDGLEVDGSGNVSINVGDGLEIGQDGSLNVTGGGGGGSWDGKVGGIDYTTVNIYKEVYNALLDRNVPRLMATIDKNGYVQTNGMAGTAQKTLFQLNDTGATIYEGMVPETGTFRAKQAVKDTDNTTDLLVDMITEKQVRYQSDVSDYTGRTATMDKTGMTLNIGHKFTSSNNPVPVVEGISGYERGRNGMMLAHATVDIDPLIDTKNTGYNRDYLTRVFRAKQGPLTGIEVSSEVYPEGTNIQNGSPNFANKHGIEQQLNVKIADDMIRAEVLRTEKDSTGNNYVGYQKYLNIAGSVAEDVDYIDSDTQEHFQRKGFVSLRMVDQVTGAIHTIGIRNGQLDIQ